MPSLVNEVAAELDKLRPPRQRAREEIARVTDDRRLEWLTTAVLGGFGVSLIVPGDTATSAPTFSAFRDVLWTGEEWLALALVLLAMARALALAVNGLRGRPTSMVRFISAAIGSGIFWMLAVGFFWPWFTGETDALSTGVITYAVLAAADYDSALKAARDARIYRLG
jgi:hypothetical protein